MRQVNEFRPLNGKRVVEGIIELVSNCLILSAMLKSQYHNDFTDIEK